MMSVRMLPVEGKPGHYERYDVHSKYEYTLKEALEYMQDHPYFFEDVILYNVCLRNLLRKMGAQMLIYVLCNIVKPKTELKMAMARFVEKWQDVPIGDFDIQLVSIYEEIDFGFATVLGLEEMKSLVEKYIYCKGNDISNKEVQQGLVHVGEVWDSYPIFDSEDLGDNRSYQNYIIRNRPISDQEMKALASVENKSNFRKLHEATPPELLPMAYYKGDGGFMLLAKTRC